MKHVAVLFEFPTLNGGEHSMLSVLRRFQSERLFQLSALAPPHGPLAEQLNALGVRTVPFIVRAASGSKRPADELLAELQDHLSVLQPDLLHANSLSMSRLVGGSRGQLGPLQCTGHLRDIMKLSRSAVSDLNQLDRLAAVSQATRSFHENQGLDTGRTDVIYNGVDINRFRLQNRCDARRALLPGLPASARVLLNVGQICLRKGQLDLAQAVVRLLQSRDDIHLVLIGRRHSEKAESRAYEQAIVDAFASSGRAEHLHRPGFCTNVDQWMNAADLLVHTARQEPLGRVLLEAAASELPIIATDVGGTSEILTDQDSAILIPPNDEIRLIAGLLSALNDLEHARSLASRARERIIQSFTIPHASSALRDFWQGDRPT